MSIATPGAGTKKRGRKAKDHVCTYDGRTINGLYRKPNGVWRIRASGQEYTEADERQAIAKFEALTRDARPKVVIPLAVGTLDQALDVAAGAGFARVGMKLRLGGAPTEYSVVVGGKEFYAAVRRLILEEPLDTARNTGIEWLAWGPNLKAPKPSPKLTTIGELYFAKTSLSPNELGRSKLFWKEFCKAVGVETVRELTHEAVAEYERRTHDKTLSPKSVLHRYRKVRGVFHYAIKRGQSPDDCRKALDVLAMLEVKGTQSLDPTPLAPDEFWAIYGEAKRAGDDVFAALLLTALNCGMYGGEVSALKWDEVDLDSGGLVTRRPKTKVSRIAVLWPQTIKALKALERHGDSVFNTRVRSFTVFSVGDRFEKYRDAAAVSGTRTFQWIRDASYSEACRVSIDQARMLAGQRVPGVSDHYLRRRPDLVADACAAIAKAFQVDERCASLDKTRRRKNK